MAGALVLIVEDTELLRQIYHDRLVQQGYRVALAANGLEALSTLRTQQVDLILLDLVMPVMSGLEALDAIKADPRTHDIPVLILSNLGQDADIERGLSMGADDYLIKSSAKPADVAEKIDSLMRRRTRPEAAATRSFNLLIRDHEADADAFATHEQLTRRFWCPACEEELALELLPQADREGWYDAHLFCPRCGREF